MLGLLNKLAGESVDKTITATGNAIDAMFTSDEEKAAAGILKQKLSQTPGFWAHQLNLANAKGGNWFNSGWRPALGWVGAICLLTFYLPQYLVAAYLWVNICLEQGQMADYPLSDNGIMELVGLLLGGAALRTFEKMGGRAR